MTMYERIRKLRIDAGMTQDDLAHAMGYKDRSMITKIESGKVDISQKKVMEFAKVLNTTPAYLMGWDEQEGNSQANIIEEKPKNDDIRFLIRGLNKMPPEQLEKAKSMMEIMFDKYFGKEGDDETGL